MARRFRIHPAVGVARVGNAPTAFFIGPEQPSVPANWVDDAFSSFRDDQGRIKRQAARFWLFEYVDDGADQLQPVQVKPGGDVVDIEWRVHIANRKASFFTFNGQSGAPDLYAARAAKPAGAPEKEAPPRANRRNAEVPPEERRSELDIDPGEQVVSSASPGPVKLTNTSAATNGIIPDLGDIQVDAEGRLLVLGGHGVSGSSQDPPVTIDEYANNDTWFDDVGDGPVKARVRLSDGTVVDADPAWVVVGPPDFVPTVANAVSLYDLMWDLAVRQLPIPLDKAFRQAELSTLISQKQMWSASGEKSLKGYVPSFTREIYPILSRALAVRDLHEPLDIDKGSYHLQLMDWTTLNSKDPTDVRNPPALREYIFGRIRKPTGTNIDWRGMPRGLGDDYDSLGPRTGKPTALFSLTQIQYALLAEWAAGNFLDDWPGTEPAIPAPEAPSPAGLDRAALENCVGGPFFPGIEVSWLVRRSELYKEPFRLDAPNAPIDEAGTPRKLGTLTFEAGFFSQQMAQPWQADFFDCHKEEFEGGDQRQYYYMWWTAQRPDDTYAPDATSQAPWVRHVVPAGEVLDPESDERFKHMVARWSNLPYVLPRNGRLEEEPR